MGVKTTAFQNPRAGVTLGNWQFLASARLIPVPLITGSGCFQGEAAVWEQPDTCNLEALSQDMSGTRGA